MIPKFRCRHRVFPEKLPKKTVNNENFCRAHRLSLYVLGIIFQSCHEYVSPRKSPLPPSVLIQMPAKVTVRPAQSAPVSNHSAIFATVESVLDLFFRTKRVVHSMVGLSYLFHYASVAILLMGNDTTSSPSIYCHRVYWLSFHGVLQTCTAIMSFRFLRMIRAEQNYFSDKSTIPYR